METDEVPSGVAMATPYPVLWLSVEVIWPPGGKLASKYIPFSSFSAGYLVFFHILLNFR